MNTCTEQTCPQHGEANRAHAAKRREDAISGPSGPSRVSLDVRKEKRP